MNKLLLLTFAALYMLLMLLMTMPFPGVLADNQEISTGEIESMPASSKGELSGSTETGSGNGNIDNSSSEQASSESDVEKSNKSKYNTCTGKEETGQNTQSIEVKSSDYKPDCFTDQEGDHVNSNSISKCAEEIAIDLEPGNPDNQINITGNDNLNVSKHQLDSEESFDAISNSKDYPDPGKKSLDSFSACLDKNDPESISETAYKAANNYTEIANQDDFDLIRNNLNGYFKLINDINLTGTWNPIGQKSDNSPFSGIFDGQGYSISNLLIESDNVPVGGYAGFFGYTSGAKVKNLNLVDVNISGTANVGALAGKAHNTEVENCRASGAVSGSGNYVGGLVGHADSTWITKSSVSGIVTADGNSVGGLVGYMTGSASIGNANITYSSADVEVIGTKCVGGLVGFTLVQSRINNSYATGTVEGESSIGGLVGEVFRDTIITNCYASSQVISGSSSASSIGGLVGRAHSESTGLNSYWDLCLSGLTESALGIGLTKEQMLLVSSFEEWDFEQTWHIGEGINSPILQWQLEQKNGNDTEQPGQENGKVDCHIPGKFFSPGFLFVSMDNNNLLLLAEESALDLIICKLNNAGLLIERILAKESADPEELYYIMELLQEAYNLLIKYTEQFDEGDFMQLFERLIIKINVVTNLIKAN